MALLYDPACWKLQLPVDKNNDGSPDEVKYPALATYTANKDLFSVSEEEIVFRAYVGGVTTSGSKYPRSELREMNGKEKASWCASTGKHSLDCTLRITHLPAVKPHVVVGQIHDSSDDVLQIRLEERKLFVERDGDEVATLDENYELGTKFNYRIVVEKDTVKVYYNKELKYTSKIEGCSNYFKVGIYVQSNPDKGDLKSEYGEARFKKILLKHTEN